MQGRSGRALSRTWNGRGAGRGWRRSPLRQSSGDAGDWTVSGLAFRQAPGPLLVVVGLAGGAGASVLAYLIAATAAAQSEAPVLLADTGGPTAAVAGYTGVTAPLTLEDISQRLAADERVPARFWADGPRGLRVLAGDPQFTVHGEDEATRRVLSDARTAHALTVVDGGTLSRPADQAALSVASHVAWVLPATVVGLTRAGQVLARITRLSRPEILVARTDLGSARPPVGGLADLADERRAPLVLMPSLGDVAGRPLRDLAGEAGVSLQALGGLLRR